MKKVRLGIITVTAIGALALGPTAANAVTSTAPSSAAHTAAAASEASAPAGSMVEPQVIGGVARAGKALYQGFKAGTSPREVGRVLGWGSFLASSPVDDAKSFDQEQAFDR